MNRVGHSWTSPSVPLNASCLKKHQNIWFMGEILILNGFGDEVNRVGHAWAR